MINANSALESPVETNDISYSINNEKTADTKRVYQFIKRLFDIMASLILLIILFIPMLIISACIKIESRGPALFMQQRTGKKAKPFTFYKFRSMYVDAPKNCATRDLSDAEEYITHVGSLLRKTSLDELPQLINIFKGEMSFIGPRPVVLTEEELINKRLVNGVYNIRPGLTGFAQVNGRDFVGVDSKVEYDAIYARKASVLFDIKIFLKTVYCVLVHKGINEGSVPEETTDESFNADDESEIECKAR